MQGFPDPNHLLKSPFLRGMRGGARREHLIFVKTLLRAPGSWLLAPISSLAAFIEMLPSQKRDLDTKLKIKTDILQPSQEGARCLFHYTFLNSSPSNRLFMNVILHVRLIVIPAALI